MTLRGQSANSARPHLQIFSPDTPPLSANSSGSSKRGNFTGNVVPCDANTSVNHTSMNETSLTSPFGRASKRVVDIVVSLPVVVFVLPPACVLAWLAHRLQSPGPLFFRQERCGLKKRPFTILKFRTMNAEDPSNGQNSEDRIFPLGQILRKTKLDEIPQFVNVLLGSMSIVGPRPHHFEDCESFSEAVEDYAQRTIAKPGITGLAQYTEYRGDFAWNCVESRVKNDLGYIRRWSLWLDIQLIAKTANVIVSKSAAKVLQRLSPAYAKPQLKLFSKSEEADALLNGSAESDQKNADRRAA